MPSLTDVRQRPVRVFLCGDVMIGRGVDQVLPDPCDPVLYEEYVRSALDYVRLAEAANGPIPKPITFSELWGTALQEFDRAQPDVRIVNLETSVTRNDAHAPKGINYRVSPENAACLSAAGIDCCVLANNHVLDWERGGLIDTLKTLDRLHINHCGAGRDLAEASAPAVLELGGIRVLIFSYASPTSGTPLHWAARANMPGVNLIADISPASAKRVAEQIAHVKRAGDIVIVSLHWGPNWGHEITEEQRHFAHVLVDDADVSIVHGHSSHHPKATEVYRNRLILYGCGEFLDDYEGIRGYEAFRDDLVLMYFASLDPQTRHLLGLEMVPLQIRCFQLCRPSTADTNWLLGVLNREGCAFGVRIQRKSDSRFRLA